MPTPEEMKEILKKLDDGDTLTQSLRATFFLLAMIALFSYFIF